MADPDVRALLAALREATVIGGTSTDIMFELGDTSSYFESAQGVESLSGEGTVADGHITRLYYGVTGSGPSQLVTIEITVPSTAAIDPPI